MSYRTKRIHYFGHELPILMQNENGPCPLLALANVLILRGGIYIHPDISEVTLHSKRVEPRVGRGDATTSAMCRAVG